MTTGLPEEITTGTNNVKGVHKKMESYDIARLEAFNWLSEKIRIYGDVLPRSVLEKGFQHNGQQIHFVGAKGIWKPKSFKLPLSITTKFEGPYEDKVAEDCFLYRYRGEDPFHKDNVGLREAMKRQTPLIYFFGIAPGKYLAIFPVFIVGDDPSTLTFSLFADDISVLKSYAQEHAPSLFLQDYEKNQKREYITSVCKIRLHQRAFREMVLSAYRTRCSFCMLKHSNLLDAAHIIPDGEDLGDPVIENGISMCKIHHAAFDSNIVGITPDYIIEVNQEVLKETDGPMLKHGIQELNNQRIILPKDENSWPDRNRLSIKYENFKRIG